MGARLWDSWSLRALAVLCVAALAVTGYGVWSAEPWVTPVVNGLFVPAAAVLTALVCVRVARDPALSPGARRFWRVYAGAQVLASTSRILVAASLLLPSDALTGAGLLLQLLAVLAYLWPLARLTPAVERGERLALWLDVLILTAGTAIALAHLAGPSSDSPVFASNVGGALVATLMVARMLLGGSRVLAPRSAVMIAVSAAAGGLLPAAATLLIGEGATGGVQARMMLLAAPAAGLAMAMAARLQVLDGSHADERPRRRPHKIIPYAAVAVVDLLLLEAALTRDANLPDLVIGAVALTALVVLRQLVAIEENTALVKRLDASLLELSREEERFRLLVQNSSDVVTLTAADGTVHYASPAVTRLLGYPAEEITGQRLSTFVHPDDLPEAHERWAEMLRTPGAASTYRARYRDASGGWRWLETINANLLHEPSVRGVLTNSRDVTETRQVQEQLRYEATHDSLTGLANRKLFAERVAAAVAQPHHAFSLVLIDLDDFKAVNDTLGHSAGDALLVAVAERMVASVRPTDTVARLGGDEFAILFEGLRGDVVDRVLVRIAEALLVPVPVEERLISVRASFGVADGRGGNDPDELMRRADVAMYEAKATGEGGHRRYTGLTTGRSASQKPSAVRAAPADPGSAR